MAQMTGMFFGIIKDAQARAYKAAEAVVNKVEAVVTHPEVRHATDLLDAMADKNMEYVQLIATYGESLVERISTRNEPKTDK